MAKNRKKRKNRQNGSQSSEDSPKQPRPKRHAGPSGHQEETEHDEDPIEENGVDETELELELDTDLDIELDLDVFDNTDDLDMKKLLEIHTKALINHTKTLQRLNKVISTMCKEQNSATTKLNSVVGTSAKNGGSIQKLDKDVKEAEKKCTENKNNIAKVDRRVHQTNTTVNTHQRDVKKELKKSEDERKKLEKRIELQEKKISDQEKEISSLKSAIQQVRDSQSGNGSDESTQQEFPYSRTLVALRVPYEDDENLMDKALDLLEIGLGFEGIPIVRVMRTPFRDHPGVVKIELESESIKIDVLRAKQVLRNAPEDWMKRVFIRSSKSHVERLIEANFRTVLNNMGSDLKVASNGRILHRETESGDYRRGNRRPRYNRQNNRQGRPHNDPPHYRTVSRNRNAQDDYDESDFYDDVSNAGNPRPVQTSQHQRPRYQPNLPRQRYQQREFI